jgi:hypothetical protein
VIATPTDGDVPTAVAVADALALVEPPLLVAFGGRGAERAVGRAGSRETLIALPQSLSDAVDALRAALDRAEDRAG